MEPPPPARGRGGRADGALRAPARRCGAAEGVGYLDEPRWPRTACTSWRSCAAGCGRRPALRIWNSLTGATEAEYRYRADEPAAGALAWSPDGRAVAVGGDDGSLTLRSADTLAPTRTLTGYRGSFRATGVGWSPDGTRLAAVDGTGTLRIWRADDGAAVGAIPVFATYTGRVVWSPRSDAVAVRCTDAGELAVVELPGGEPGPVRRLAGSGPVRPPSPGRRTARCFAAGFSARTAPGGVPARRRGFTRRRPSGRTPRPVTVAWSPDGTAVASTSAAPPGDGVVRVFDGRTGAPTGRFPGGTRCSRTRCGRRTAPRRRRRRHRDRHVARARRGPGPVGEPAAALRFPPAGLDRRRPPDHRRRPRPRGAGVARGRAEPVVEWAVSPWAMLLREMLRDRARPRKRAPHPGSALGAEPPRCVRTRVRSACRSSP